LQNLVLSETGIGLRGCLTVMKLALECMTSDQYQTRFRQSVLTSTWTCWQTVEVGAASPPDVHHIGSDCGCETCSVGDRPSHPIWMI